MTDDIENIDECKEWRKSAYINITRFLFIYPIVLNVSLSYDIFWLLIFKIYQDLFVSSSIVG